MRVLRRFVYVVRELSAPGVARLWKIAGSEGPAVDAVHLVVLCAIAIAQPIWSLVGKSGEFFVARNADAAEIVLAALAVLAGPPAVLIALQWIAAIFNPRARRIVHLLAVCGLILLMFVRLAGRVLSQPAWLVIGLGAAAAAVGITAFLWTRAARLALSFLTPLPVVLLLLFLFASEAGAVVRSYEPPGLKQPLSTTNKPSLVFLIFDELPGMSIMNENMQIDAVRVPNLARFARQAHWFRNATTVHEGTDMAVPAMLSGNRALPEELPVSARYPVNLFTVLGRAGYQIRADEHLTRLCPRVYCPNPAERTPLLSRVGRELADLAMVYAHEAAPQNMTRHLPQLNLAWGNFLAPKAGEPRKVGLRGALVDGGQDQGARIDFFLKGLKPARVPTLHYLHTTISHAPFDRLPNAKSYAPDDMAGLEPDGSWRSDEFLAAQAQQRTLLQVGYVDYQFGRIVDRLRAVGRFDDSLIVVAADHGSANLPGVQRRAFTKQTLGDVASVPLLIKLPGQKRGEMVDDPAETLDILPTIADVIGMRLPGQVEGHSLLQRNNTRRTRTLISRSGQRFHIAPDFPQRRSAIARNYSRFGRQGDSLNLFAVGRYRSLVGKQASSLRVSTTAALTAVLDNPGALKGELSAGMSPSRIMGKLSGVPAGVGKDEPIDLLITVGDTIVATSRTYDVNGDDSRLSMFVPDEALSLQEELAIFAITRPVKDPEITRVLWS